MQMIHGSIGERLYNKHHYALISCLHKYLHQIPYLYSADDTRDSEHVENFYADMQEHIKHIAVRATYGCGKTYHGIRPGLEKIVKMGKTVIIPTEKRSLNGHFFKTLSDLGFQRYNDIKDSITSKKYPLLIIQLDECC